MRAATDEVANTVACLPSDELLRTMLHAGRFHQRGKPRHAPLQRFEIWARSAVALCSSAEVPTHHRNFDESIRVISSLDTNPLKPLCPFEQELRIKN